MGNPAKTCQKKLEMHLAPQLIHLLLTEDFCNDLCGRKEFFFIFIFFAYKNNFVFKSFASIYDAGLCARECSRQRWLLTGFTVCRRAPLNTS